MHRLLAFISSALVLACDQGPAAPGALDAAAAAVPNVQGSYHGTGVATVSTSTGQHKSLTCKGTLNIGTQADNSFSGTFVVPSAGDCDEDSGTLAGTVGVDGDVTFTADLPGGGADIWEDGAARSGCRLESSTSFMGAVTGDALSAKGSGAYDCDTVFGTIRLFVELQVSASRAATS